MAKKQKLLQKHDWRTLARKAYPEAESIDSNGPYALVLKCRDLTITLYETEEAATSALDYWANDSCGGRCVVAMARIRNRALHYAWHEVRDLRQPAASTPDDETEALKAIVSMDAFAKTLTSWSRLSGLPSARLREAAEKLIMQGWVVRKQHLWVLAP